MDFYIILISLVFSAFFSGIEIAYVSANKLKVELSRKKGHLTGKIISWFSKLPSYFIGAMLIGNNIALVVFGIMMARILEPALIHILPPLLETEIVLLLIQTLISTLIVLLIGEFMPKVLFRINPNGILGFFALPLAGIFFLLSPFVAFVITLSKLILRGVFRIRVEESKPVFSKMDLEHFVKEVPQTEEDTEINTELFENALYLIKVRIRECMVPRPEIKAIDINASISQLKKIFIETQLSRIIVYNESIDNVMGYVHHHELLNRPENIRSILYPLPVLPETMPAMDVLNLFTKKRKTIAVVVDEFGGTAGIVTLEDILEEIFGEIQDEHDSITFVEKKLKDNEYIFSGRLEIDYINEKYDLDLPEGEYETLAGLIFSQHESIPEKNQVITMEHFEIRILYVSDTKIETVQLKRLD